LAVSTVDNGIKVLANADGVRLLRTLENRSFDASRSASETVTKVVFVTNKLFEDVLCFFRMHGSIIPHWCSL
jgi:hypothetical protein